MKVKKILVATDLSSMADLAIERAVSIAKSHDAHITILHVLQKNFYANALKLLGYQIPLKSSKAYVNEQLQKKITSFYHHKLNIDYKIITQNRPVIKIIQFAKKNNFDLLIIGAHGKYSLRDAFVGTTAEHVAEKTPCPVLVIKNKSVKHYQKIFVPVDFSNTSKKALNTAIQLFPRSRIHLFHVGDFEYEDFFKQEERTKSYARVKINELRKTMIALLTQQLKKFISKHKHKFTYRVALGYPGPTIIEEIKKNKPDLIIMGTRGHSNLHYLFFGRVANWVMMEVENDILLVPPANLKT